MIQILNLIKTQMEIQIILKKMKKKEKRKKKELMEKEKRRKIKLISDFIININ